MALGKESSTQFVIEWTFFAEGQTGENAVCNTSDYSCHNDCFFQAPRGVVKSPFAGNWLARKSQGFGKICVESFPKYIKLFRAQDGFYQLIWRERPNINN